MSKSLFCRYTNLRKNTQEKNKPKYIKKKTFPYTQQRERNKKWNATAGVTKVAKHDL